MAKSASGDFCQKIRRVDRPKRQSSPHDRRWVRYPGDQFTGRDLRGQRDKRTALTLFKGKNESQVCQNNHLEGLGFADGGEPIGRKPKIGSYYIGFSSTS